MTYYNLMLLIKDILNENKNVSFGVESLLSEIKKMVVLLMIINCGWISEK